MSVSGYFKKSLGLETWGWLESLQKASQLRSISSIGPGTGDSALKAVRYIGEKLPRASPTWSEDIGVERCTSETFNNKGRLQTASRSALKVRQVSFSPGRSKILQLLQKLRFEIFPCYEHPPGHQEGNT